VTLSEMNNNNSRSQS